MEQDRICGYLFDTNTGGLIGVNDLGKLIAELFVKGFICKEIADYIKADNNIKMAGTDIEAQVQDFLEQLKEAGLIRNSLRVIGKNSEFQLLNVQLDLTWHCNLKCRHCYLNDVSLIAPPLELNDWKYVIEQIRDMEVPKLTFLGGEPILSVWFFYLAEFATDLGFKLFTTTNGTTVTPEIAKRLVSSGFNEIDVSLDGARPASHDYLRGSGVFKKTLKGIDNLQSVGLKVKTATVLYKGNLSEVSAMLAMGQERGIDQMYFNPLLPGQNGEEFWLKQALDFHEWKAAKKFISSWNDDGQMPEAFAESSFDFNAKRLKKSEFPVLDYVGCKAGKREIIITPDGYAAICPIVSTDRKFQTMNVRDFTLREIWQNDPWVKKLRRINVAALAGKCRHCSAAAVCLGGCHMLAYMQTGKINNPDPRCPHLEE